MKKYRKRHSHNVRQRLCRHKVCSWPVDIGGAGLTVKQAFVIFRLIHLNLKYMYILLSLYENACIIDFIHYMSNYILSK